MVRRTMLVRSRRIRAADEADRPVRGFPATR